MVQIVQKLVETGAIDLVHTIDGKQYITPQRLDREILDELLAHKGVSERGRDARIATSIMLLCFP